MQKAMPQKKDGDEQVVEGLDQLNKLAGRIKLRAPRLRALPDVSGKGQTVKEKIQTVKQIREDVGNAMAWLHSVAEEVASYDPETEDGRLGRRIAEEEYKGDVTETNTYLDDILASEDLLWKSAAAAAYIKSRLSGDFRTYQEAFDALRDLETRKLLAEAVNGAIRVGYKHYQVNPEFAIAPDDIAQFSGVIATFSKTLMGLVRQQRQEITKELQEQSEMSLEEAMAAANKDGKCLLAIPPESYIGQGGKEMWGGGGNLLVHFSAQKVVPLRATGSIERSVDDMLKLRVFLPRYTVSWGTAPASGCDALAKAVSWAMANIEIYDKGLKRKRTLNSDEAKEYVRLERLLWRWLNRTHKDLKAKKAMEAQRTEFSGKATIKPPEAFGLNGDAGNPKYGIALLEFNGTFRQSDGKSIPSPFLLVSLSEEEGQTMIEIVGLPRHLQSFLGEFAGKKYPVRDSFNSCPPQLRRMLRAIRGQVEMAMEVK